MLPLYSGTDLCKRTRVYTMSGPHFLKTISAVKIGKRSPRYFDSGAALWIHDKTARKIIYDLKFQNKRDNAELIGFETALHMRSQIELWNAEAFRRPA